MPGYRNDPQIGLGPEFRQTIGRIRRADHVVTALHDHPGDMGDAVHVVIDVFVLAKETGIHEIMVFQTGKGPGVIRRAVAAMAVGMYRGQGVFPRTPSLGIPHLFGAIPREQTPVIGAYHVAALLGWNEFLEPGPGFWPEPPGPPTIKPVKLGLRHGKHATQHEMAHPVSMALRIDKGQCGAPAAAKDDPVIDSERIADAFDIRHEVPRRIVLDTRMRLGAPASALIEQDDAIYVRVEIPPHCRAAPSAGPAMQDDNGQSIGVSRLLDINLVCRPQLEKTTNVWFNRRVKILNCALLA